MQWVLLCTIFAVASNAAVVPFITPCLWSDKECLISSSKKALPYFVEGIKELDLAPVSPIFIKEAIADSGDLKLKLDDLTVVGLEKAELVKIERDSEKSTLSLIIDTPIKATGTYTAGGKLLFLDVVGHGDTEMKTDKARLWVDVKLKKFDKDGKAYYKFDGYEFKYEVLEQFFFKFDNLFNGDKAKADPILTIIRENWRDLIADFGKPVIKKIADIVIGNIEKFFTNIPLDELELAA